MSLGKVIKHLLIILALALMLAAAALGYAWYYWQDWMQKPLELPKEGIYLTIEKGDSLSHALKDLAQQNILQYPRWLRRYAQFKQQTKIHQGEYFLQQGLTPETLLVKFNKGDVVVYQIRFPEGWTAKQLLTILKQDTRLKSETQNLSPEEIAKKLGIDNGQLEGWLFPDTYSFTRNTPDLEVLQQAHQKMQRLLEKKWQNRAKELPYKTAYEALILASIVERETGHLDERDKIAGVFVRRLQKGMKLQTDPTVIYGMGDAFQGGISRNDLQNPTAYNTYVISGLPPTPISMPSLASLDAVMHPAPGNALYFVAKGDGTSKFSDTYEEHKMAVREYQLKRRSDYRSSP